MQLIKDSYGKSQHIRYIKTGNNQFQIPFASKVLASENEKMFAVFSIDTNSWVIYDNNGNRQIGADYKNINKILDDGSVVTNVGEGYIQKNGAYKDFKYEQGLFKDGKQLLTSKQSNFSMGIGGQHFINEDGEFKLTTPNGNIVYGRGRLAVSDVDGFYSVFNAENKQIGYVDMLGRPLNTSSTPSVRPTHSGMDFYNFHLGKMNLNELKGEYYQDPAFRKAVLTELKRKAQMDINSAQIDALIKLDNPNKFKSLLNDLNHKFKDAQRSAGKENSEQISKQAVEKISKITDNWQTYIEDIIAQISAHNY